MILPVQAGEAPIALRGSQVLLRADRLRLVLPQRDVGAARTIDTPPRPTAERGVFVIGEGEHSRPVVALSAAMRPLPEFPPERFVLVQMAIGQAELWFAWSEVRVLGRQTLEGQPLPPVMRLPGAPIDGWLSLDGEIALITGAERLVEYALARRS